MRIAPLSPALAALAVCLAACACSRDPRGGSPTPGPTESPTGSPSPTPTAAPGELRFVAIGDTGTGDEGQFLVADAIRAFCAENRCDFLVLLGDNFYPGGVTSTEDPQWLDKVEDPYAPLGMPIRPVLGNHDYGENGDDFDRGRHQVAYSAGHPFWWMPDEHYSFGDERALLVALDTEKLLFDEEDAVMQQSLRVDAWIAEAPVETWRIALGHHPYRSNGDHGNAGSYDGHPAGSIGSGKHLKDFYESAICGRFDLMLAGHDHSLQAFAGTDDCPTPVVVSGAGAFAGSLPGSQPALFASDAIGFAYVVATDAFLEVRMVDASGETLFRTSFDRVSP